MWKLLCLIIHIVLLTLSFCRTAVADVTSPNTRIKDIARISSVYDSPIYGYGLVVGLNGTGDSAGAMFTVQSVANMMQKFGIDVPRNRLSVKNVAAVMVTANIPFFAKVGSRIDVLVSSIGDAKSLSGGTLLATPLTLPDGKVCVLAQGPVFVGGFSVSSGSESNNIQKNHPTVGRVPNGGLVQYVPTANYLNSNQLSISLEHPDFTTAARVVNAINDKFPGIAKAVDASQINVNIPESYSNVVQFISELENIVLSPDTRAEVVIDERTGTIVIGSAVRISPVAVSHGNISIQIKSEEEVSQPSPLSLGETVITRKEDIKVEEEKEKLRVLQPGASIEEVVRALNMLGVSPRDMIIILQAMKKAGALHANIVTM